MIPLLLFILLVVIVVVLYEIRERQRAKAPSLEGRDGERSSECCGEHLVCERETLLQTNAEIVYYDDEELDQLADTDPKDYTEAQHAQLRDVFETLKEEDVPGWCRSLQLRRIALPDDIKDEALMIVRERRNSK